MRAAIAMFGLGAGVLTVKVLALGMAGWELLPRRYALVVPAGLAVPSVGAVNLDVLL